MLSLSPKLETISLTANGALNIPAISLRGTYPDGAEAELVFTDDAGITLLTLDGDFSSGVGIAFEADPATVANANLVAGTHFVIFVTLPWMDPYAGWYGTVIRSEPNYPLAPTVDTSNNMVQFTANFIDGSAGPKWIPTYGSIAVHTQSLISQDPSLGPDYVLISAFGKAAARWYAPMSMDSVTVAVKLINNGDGLFNVMVCSDYSMNTYLGIQFSTDVANTAKQFVQAFTGSGPTGGNLQGSPVSHNVVNGDTYTIKYDSLANTLSVYYGTSLTPLLSWVDNGNIVPHGAGFRYTGLGWFTSLLAPGCEPTAWQAHDGV